MDYGTGIILEGIESQQGLKLGGGASKGIILEGIESFFKERRIFRNYE
ncbi:hypothetical protein J5U23_01681 [Saccharolobus shibatae B12]|uniref:Uncharacterized protein n=1 Tax=Saccharolobus shibatae (strain ATCC 51178 / DSM 5389 / JCM 8931 / NBRC 15437 / B12) TaxID=523848 RepID=A0A8F5BP21_SACSH|nr:hypothetical protein J5U23_01681 [Saccharolobus shibatae B12]